MWDSGHDTPRTPPGSLLVESEWVPLNNGVDDPHESRGSPRRSRHLVEERVPYGKGTTGRRSPSSKSRVSGCTPVETPNWLRNRPDVRSSRREQWVRTKKVEGRRPQLKNICGTRVCTRVVGVFGLTLWVWPPVRVLDRLTLLRVDCSRFDLVSERGRLTLTTTSPDQVETLLRSESYHSNLDSVNFLIILTTNISSIFLHWSNTINLN